MTAFQRILDFIIRMTPGLILAAILFPALYPLRQKRLTGKGLVSRPAREILLALLWMFCGGMAVLTLTPPGFNWRFRWSWYLPTPFSGSVSLVPFRTFRQSGLVLLGNIIMFVPFGLFSSLLFRGFRWRRALLLGICITVFIECTQLLVGRSFDIDDLMLNTLGVLCGWLLWKLIRRFAPAFSEHFWAKTK